MTRGLFEKLNWSMKVQLERPSNYDRRVVLDAADVYQLMDLARGAES
jgi:hypothetical protein